MNAIRDLTKNINTLLYLVSIGTPAKILIAIVRDGIRVHTTFTWNQSIISAKRRWKDSLSNKVFTENVFDSNIPHWLHTFRKQQLLNKKIDALEIGSYEGRSALFLLNTLSQAHLTVIDPWDPAIYRKEVLGTNVEERFDANCVEHKHRIRKIKSTSSNAFGTIQQEGRIFDLIYVDGSHWADQVHIDAVNCWELLRNQGILIFDDYTWREYPNKKDNPAWAINAFLESIEGKYEILWAYTQIIIKKTLR